jgi:uncharacterized protein YkwD
MRSTRDGSWRTSAVALLVAVACGPAAPPTAPAPPPEPEAVAEPSPEPGGEIPPAEPTPAAPAADDGPVGDAGELLAAHNRYRGQHCAAPLTWSAALAASAQRWADRLRDAGCAFAHSQTQHGENLAAGTSGTLTPEAVVTMWYREVAAYDFRGGAFSMETGHFTQVVWRGTTQLGCGRSSCRGLDVWVCQYDPPGNMLGAFQRNVLPTGCR